MFYKMDTRNGEILVKNDFNKPKLADHYLSKLNQVYFVTKQVPQEVSRKPELAYLPIIQNAPIKTNLKTNFLSGALISSLNSMESFQMTRSASNSAKSRRTNHKSHQTRTILSFGTVVNVPKKSTENLFVRNGFNVTLNTPYRLQSYRKVDRKSANSSPIIARETSAELKTKLQNTPVHGFTRSTTETEIRRRPKTQHRASSMTRSTSSCVLTTSDNFKNYKMIIKKLDREFS